MNRKKIGYIAIELVICASLILAIGFFALLNLGGTGAAMMERGMARLDATGVFGIFGGGGDNYVSTMSYDAKGYLASLNVNSADINPTSDFLFVKNGDGTWTLSDYLSKNDQTVIIPKYHADGKLITAIGRSAFNSDDGAFTETTLALSGGVVYTAEGGDPGVEPWKITSLIIPNSVKIIKDDAFTGNSIESVLIPDSVIEIGDRAFYGNLLLGELTIPNSVKTMGAFAFSGNQLSFINLSNRLTTISEGAFLGNCLEWVIIPEGVESIGLNAFRQNMLLTATLPTTLKTIGVNAFMQNQIHTLTLPIGLTSIGDSAFSSNKLTVFDLPSGLKTIGAQAFTANLISNIFIPESVIEIGDAAFYGNQIEYVNFEGNVPALPLVVGNRLGVFTGNLLGVGSINVSYYSEMFRAKSVEFGVDPSAFN